MTLDDEEEVVLFLVVLRRLLIRLLLRLLEEEVVLDNEEEVARLLLVSDTGFDTTTPFPINQALRSLMLISLINSLFLIKVHDGHVVLFCV